MPARCESCAATLPPSARFCASCGEPVPLGYRETELRLTPRRAVQGISTADEPPGSSILPPARIPEGTRVSVYRIEGVIGEGGMGVVYRARDEALDRTVALKFLHTNLAGNIDIKRRFLREAKLLRSWTHPNVVRVHDLIELEDTAAIVMELIEGPTLIGHLKRWRGRMPWGEVGVIFSAVLDAMGDGHKRGIIHRDLKPENILVTMTPRGLVPKIVDFGIAKILEGTTYTMSGAFLGTSAYMSPEQVKNPVAAGPGSDIYSLGVTLYQLATGRVPFEGNNHFSVMMAHVDEEPAAPSTLRRDIPPELERLILDALAKAPSARPPSCEVFRQRLEGVLAPYAMLHVDGGHGSDAPPAPVLKEVGGEEMVLVPEGRFLMGQHKRSIVMNAYYVDRTPVSNRQFLRFLEVTGYTPSGPDTSRFLSHLHGHLGATLAQRPLVVPDKVADHPVVYVSWEDARAYAAWAGKRLPSEAEWEKAARGADGRKYPWGREEPTPSRANYGRRDGGTTPVGAFPNGASPWGALDMAGNVWEWCEDVDDPSFYTNGPPMNPCNTAAGERRVMRGGAWMFGAKSLRTYERTSFEPHSRFASGGFRCVRGA